MKYGIQAVPPSGESLYLTTTVSPPVHDVKSYTSINIDDVAAFATEEAAAATVKRLRKRGVERHLGATLEVIAVSYVVKAVIDVPQPPKQSGFVVVYEKAGKELYYSGARKGVDVPWHHLTDAIEGATVFAVEDQAEVTSNILLQSMTAIAHRSGKRKDVCGYEAWRQVFASPRVIALP